MAEASDYEEIADQLNARWDDQAGSEFRVALRRLSVLADSGHLEAVEFLAEGTYGSDLNEAASYYAGEAFERAREVKDMAKNIAQETTSYAKRAATEASEAARQAVDRLGEVLGRRRD